MGEGGGRWVGVMVGRCGCGGGMDVFFFFFKQKTAYEIYQCDWSSDVCSSDLVGRLLLPDGTIHLRMCEGRFVTLVVPTAAIAVHVDDDVPLKLASEVERQIDDLDRKSVV